MKKLLKTAISLLLICTTLLLTGCSGGYREERSSRKDREIVAKIGKFEIKYELEGEENVRCVSKVAV